MGSRHYRAHQRFSVDLEATVRARSRPIQSVGRVLDLGVGGAACELETPLRLGEIVELEFTSEPHLSVGGEVAWVTWAEGSTVRLGVRFRAEDEDTLLGLLDWLGVHADVGSE